MARITAAEGASNARALPGEPGYIEPEQDDPATLATTPAEPAVTEPKPARAAKAKAEPKDAGPKWPGDEEGGDG